MIYITVLSYFFFQVGLKDLPHFLKLHPIRFFDKFIDIKGKLLTYVRLLLYKSCELSPKIR